MSGGEEGGTYFVDQSGQYYYQASGDDTPVMTQVQIQEIDDGEAQEGEVSEEQYHEIEELDAVEGDEDVCIFHVFKFTRFSTYEGLKFKKLLIELTRCDFLS